MKNYYPYAERRADAAQESLDRATCAKAEAERAAALRTARKAQTGNGGFPARYDGVCAYCGHPFAAGEMIASANGAGYGHAGCVPASSRTAQARYVFEPLEARYPGDYGDLRDECRQFVRLGDARAHLESRTWTRAQIRDLATGEVVESK